MNEQELRALVREAIERHLGRPEGRARAPLSPAPVEKDTRPLSAHVSHILLQVAPGSQMDEGMCLIEPSVRCNHCGFCQSYGH